MRLVSSIFLTLALMVSPIASSIAQVEHPNPGLYKLVADNALRHKVDIDIPTRITNKKQITKLISKLENKKLAQMMQKDIAKAKTNISVSVDWTKTGFRLTQEENELDINLSDNTLSFNGHDFHLDTKEINYKELQSFLEKHYKMNSVTIFNALIPNAHAFEPVTIIMGVVALAIYVPMIKDFSNRACKKHRKDITDEINELTNSCQSDLAMLEEGSHPRERFDTETRIDKLKEISNLIGDDGSDYSCHEGLPEEIQCIDEDHKEYIDKACKALEELSSCLTKFEKLAPTSVNQSSRDKSGHRPVGGRPTNTYPANSEDR